MILEKSYNSDYYKCFIPTPNGIGNILDFQDLFQGSTENHNKLLNFRGFFGIIHQDNLIMENSFNLKWSPYSRKIIFEFPLFVFSEYGKLFYDFIGPIVKK